MSDLTVDPSHESYDPLDEILSLFRANTFFRNFEIKGPADRLLIYGILFVSELLGKIKPNMNRRDAEKVGGTISTSPHKRVAQIRWLVEMLLWDTI